MPTSKIDVIFFKNLKGHCYKACEVLNHVIKDFKGLIIWTNDTFLRLCTKIGALTLKVSNLKPRR